MHIKPHIIKTAFIGLGYRGMQLFNLLRHIPGFRATAFADPGKPGIALSETKAYTRGEADYVRMLREQTPRLVFVASPWKCHVEHAMRCIEHGADVALEIKGGLYVDEYRPLLDTLHDRLPGVHVIFTVSPIRHWKDGAHENNLSKATLLLAIDTLQREFDYVEYFPAYELLLDELRDYRYYAEDMLHPSEVAVNYIWERFAECYFAPDTRQQMKEISQLMADRAHRPLHPESDASRQFAARTRERQVELERKYPFIRERLGYTTDAK